MQGCKTIQINVMLHISLYNDIQFLFSYGILFITKFLYILLRCYWTRNILQKEHLLKDNNKNSFKKNMLCIFHLPQTKKNPLNFQKFFQKKNLKLYFDYILFQILTKKKRFQTSYNCLKVFKIFGSFSNYFEMFLNSRKLYIFCN